MAIKSIYVLLATLISLAAYVPYVRDVLNGKTRPHIFSWFVWSTLTGIAFFGQVAGGAGSGAFVLGFTTVACFLITTLSLKKGTRDIKPIDWLAMVGAFVALFLWLMTKSPFWSVIIITVTDLLATLPTIRKTYNNPYQETGSFYLLNTVKFSLAVMALERYTLVTSLYLTYLLLANGAIFFLIFLRRRQIKDPGLPAKKTKKGKK